MDHYHETNPPTLLKSAVMGGKSERGKRGEAKGRSMSDADKLEWLWANCKIVHFPKTGAVRYYEHAPLAGKDLRKEIEVCMRQDT